MIDAALQIRSNQVAPRRIDIIIQPGKDIMNKLVLLLEGFEEVLDDLNL